MTNYSIKDSNAFYSLGKTMDPYSMGRVLGAGYQSIIIKPYDEYLMDELKLKNPVLVLTKEPEKFILLKKLFKKNVQKLKITNFNEETQDFFNYLKSEDWNLFYMEKMEEHEIKYSSKELIQKAFYELSKDVSHLEFNKNNFYYYIDNLKEYFKKYGVKEKGLYLSIKKAFTALKNTDIKSNFKIDLHMEQFLKHEGKLVCVDPVLFNFK